MHRKFLINFILICFWSTNSLAEEKILITINQFVSHISLDAVQAGLNDALRNREIIPERASIIAGNAQGNISNSVQISKHHASFKPKFMVAIATASAQTNLKAMGSDSDTILAFAAVTDPSEANLTGHDNVIGVTDDPPLEELINLAMQIFPNLKIVGVISNSGEVNSVKVTEDLKVILDKHNIKLKKVSISSSNDVKNAMNKLIGEVDFIYLPQDNSLVSALENIVSISKITKTPLLASDPTLVDKGVLMALGANYFKSGEQLGNMIADLMDGKVLEPSIQNMTAKELKINKQLAEEFGIDIPKTLVEGDK
jgi:putative ABC transport system substrate-binding protein